MTTSVIDALEAPGLGIHLRWSGLFFGSYGMRYRICFLLALSAVHVHVLAVDRLTPQNDNDIVEVLSAITRERLPLATSSSGKSTSPAVSASANLDANTAIRLARQDISVARQTGDTRYWGRAQSTLAAWWDKADAPPDFAVLQATVMQGRHEFEASRAVLVSALKRDPRHAQGWLNLAALERLSGRYLQALQACSAVGRAGQALYAEACSLETESLQGQQAVATGRLSALVGQTRDASRRSWLLSLLAENLERSGDDAGAARAYAQSLASESDLYTAIAFSDLLLRTNRPAQALKILVPLPATDAVVLRIATAHKRLGKSEWKAEREVLSTRVEELRRRGDDVTLHGRELALALLWLDGDAAKALVAARANLNLQKEPIDWWVALQSANQAGDQAALTELKAALAATGLQDVRLGAIGSARKAGA